MKIHLPAARRSSAALIACTTASALVLMFSGTADAAIVPTVGLGTAAQYSVLAGSTITNTGPSVLHRSLGLWAGTSVIGFDQPGGPGTVLGTQNITNGAAQIAKSDLTVAYINAAGRPINGTTPADLANLQLQAGVYAGPSHGALLLSGPLVLDGAGNANSVFIIQTDSTLTTSTGSTVSLINGAQECNVFWQIGSSATLGTSSVFSGTIMALSSITVTTGVTVHGRALARNGAVTLDTDVFTSPTCAGTTGGGGSSGGGTTPTTVPAAGAGTGTGTGTTPTGTGTATGTGTGTGTDLTSSGVPGVSGPPRTGGAPLRTPAGSPWPTALFAILIGAGAVAVIPRHRLHVRNAR